MIKNEQKPKEKLNFFLFIETLICVGIVFFNCTEKPNSVSGLFTVSFIVLIVRYIYHLGQDKEFNANDLLVMVIIVVSFINILISSVVNYINLSFEYLKAYFIFVSTILFFKLAENIKINKKTCNVVFLSHIIISLIYLFVYKFKPQPYSPFSSNALKVYFSNSNLAGMFLLQTVLYMVLGIVYFKNIFLKFSCFLFTITNSVLLYKTDARNAYLSLFLFFVIVFLSVFKADFKFSKIFVFLVNIAPIAFVPLYLFYINIIVNKGWLNFLVSEGKSLNSRVRIWNEFFDTLNDMWFTGNYARTHGNAHNSQMVLLCSYGLFILVLVIILNCSLVNSISKNINSKFQTFCLAAFFAIIFMGMGEGALYSGGMGIYIMSGTFLMLANCDIKQDDDMKIINKINNLF